MPLPRLQAVARMPVPKRFREHQVIPGSGCCIGDNFVGMDHARHRHAVLQFLVHHRMAAHDDHACRRGALLSTPENQPQTLRVELVGITGNVECRERPPAHGVDIAEGVGIAIRPNV